MYLIEFSGDISSARAAAKKAVTDSDLDVGKNQASEKRGRIPKKKWTSSETEESDEDADVSTSKKFCSSQEALNVDTPAVGLYNSGKRTIALSF